MKKYGVVLIGCGHIGQEHIADIYYRDNIEIIAVIDTDLERAKSFKDRYNAKYADVDYLPYLKREETDIVIIAAPASVHLKILKDVLKFNKHVLCEKPLATNEKDGEEFFNLCKNASVKVHIGHILRYNNTFIKVKELINSGVIGNLKTARMIQNHHIINVERYHSLLRDCTPLLDCGVHYYDLLQWISGGKITHVGGFSTKVSSEFNDITFDYGVANLYLDNGVVGYYEAGWTRSLMSNNTKEFIGDKGSISVTLNQFRGVHTEEGDLIEVYKNTDNSYLSINVPSNYKPMYAQLSALIDEIEGRENTNTPSIDEAYYAFKIGVAANEACLNKKIVEIK